MCIDVDFGDLYCIAIPHHDPLEGLYLLWKAGGTHYVWVFQLYRFYKKQQLIDDDRQRETCSKSHLF